MEILWFDDEIVIWLSEPELLIIRAIDEYTVYTWRTHISCSVVFSAFTRGEHRVLKHVTRSVDIGNSSFTESAVDCPFFYTLWYFLVSAYGVGTCIVSLSDIASRIYLVVGRIIIPLSQDI